MDIIALESINFFNEQQEMERRNMMEYNNLLRFQEFKAEMLKYENFTEEELQEMWEAELLVEQDL